MEIPSYTSNIQPYGSESGTKLASKYDGVQQVSSQKEQVSTTEASEKASQTVEKAIEASKEREKLNRAERERIVEQMNDFISSINKGLSFRVDEESGRDVVTIYEADTGDIIRQIPDEEMLEILRRLREQTARYSSGLVNQTV
ncbi:flagellar protein FlaG [Vibrio brasiliensis]|jgi:flagellar protein FlaG|uniref:Flagellar protein FlaG n=1 Tax=Vibrio brasiliensis LMG 20546 TaxID=945543 RepID=E8LPI0_9VIBR|nr:flagellar protein FlaG [Vibrio brasiliensis]EGA67387.1 flagellar protein FlaG [Vibrio brasiliensis LMG 20546]MCG9649525.1 flagellar protein FlaG [Vibrio brasiliensis]MCG9724235.1 flagellar protein FlaG [Vibrio brasiliensis]MCG9748923.1 flagellar protein FlaG [Vibrio brasiliensis]MCG9782122.1 flagellar protein FlaG [Vibrio brasiliensis]